MCLYWGGEQGYVELEEPPLTRGSTCLRVATMSTVWSFATSVYHILEARDVPCIYRIDSDNDPQLAESAPPGSGKLASPAR